MTAPLQTDLAIVGSGFGGSLLAMVARRLGWRVALLERSRHPRFAIGESASPLAGVVLEQLAQRYQLPRVAPLASYGSWRRHYPHVVCGLKRGFTYYKHERDRRFARADDRRHELLVAASPADELSDTHWLRADVDHFLVQEAVTLGVEYLDELRLDAVDWRAAGPLLTGTRRGRTTAIASRFIVDASGPHGFLARALQLPASGFGAYPPTQALYSHFVDVARCADIADFSGGGTAPYDIDAAALHHVFDDGWMWVLRFDNGVTSAGVAMTEPMAAELQLADGEPAWQRLLARYPSIRAQFAGATPIREFTWMPRVAWRAAAAAGDGWAMLPSAAAFVDPLFSTGIPMTLLGIERLARLLETGRLPDAATAYAPTTLAEADHVAAFIAGCYAAFPRFEDFTAWSMFYFAAASFSEMSRRLHGDGWSRGFLLSADDRIAEVMREVSPATGAVPALSARVGAAIDPINVAGLLAAGKRNWYGVDVEETAAAASKLGADATAVRRLFAYAGLSTKLNSAVT